MVRAAPCLFGLYTVVAFLYQALPAEARCASVRWPGKRETTFSDALTSVRQWLWSEWAFPQVEGGSALKKLPVPLQNLLWSALAPAA